MIAYHYDNNSIHCHLLSNFKGIELKTSCQKIREELVHYGLTLNYHFLDNEVSKILKEYMKLVTEKYQPVPPNIHRHNAAKISIQTFKNHLVRGLAGVKNPLRCIYVAEYYTSASSP